MPRYYIEIRLIECEFGQQVEDGKAVSSTTARMPTEVKELAEAWTLPLAHALTGVQKMAEKLNA